jgi:uncharacterized membrane protein YedE/YeeE
MHDFTPVTATIGGVLIGTAAALLWLGDGRIAGISGILGGLPTAARGDRLWRTAFLAGMLAAPLLYRIAAGAVSPPRIDASSAGLIAAGLLVGFGTRLGGGCTSGHGVCGLARLSTRSMVATALFVGTAGVTVFIVRHAIGDW